ncbi:MAG: hypothetical protein OXF02_02145 [Simkaniaceae bacterium]|nr:hypothetical protein [Simkaniaceae bacterium]
MATKQQTDPLTRIEDTVIEIGRNIEEAIKVIGSEDMFPFLATAKYGCQSDALFLFRMGKVEYYSICRNLLRCETFVGMVETVFGDTEEDLSDDELKDATRNALHNAKVELRNIGHTIAYERSYLRGRDG